MESPVPAVRRESRTGKTVKRGQGREFKNVVVCDYGDHGRWRNVRPLQGEQHRQEFDRRYVRDVHAPGVGMSLSLKRLLEGTGATCTVTELACATRWPLNPPVPRVGRDRVP